MMPVALTHTVTHMGKRTDGAHGAKSFRPHPFCGKNARKPLCRNGWRAFYHLVRMRSAVRIRPAAPKRRDTHSCVSSFLELHFCRAKVAAREQRNPQRFPPHTPPSLRYAEGMRATKSVDDHKTKTTRQGGFLFFKLRCFFSVLEKNVGFLICILFNKQ